MTRYDLLLLIHLTFAIIWVGSGFILSVLAWRAERNDDPDALHRLMDDTSALSKTVFIPAALGTVIAGVALTVDGPWTFDQLWVVLGIAGFASTFVTGAFVLDPWTRRIAAIVERDGGMSPPAYLEARRLLTVGRIDYVVIYLVVVDMVLKPTGDDVGVLLAMAAVLVLGAGYFLTKARGISEREATARA